MIEELTYTPSLFRDRRLGWIARRKFSVSGDTIESAKADLEKHLDSAPSHPRSRLLRFQRVESNGTDEKGRFVFVAIYWLPVNRDRTVEIRMAGSL